jgi:hypothetical protein
LRLGQVDFDRMAQGRRGASADVTDARHCRNALAIREHDIDRLPWRKDIDVRPSGQAKYERIERLRVLLQHLDVAVT